VNSHLAAAIASDNNTIGSQNAFPALFALPLIPSSVEYRELTKTAGVRFTMHLTYSIILALVVLSVVAAAPGSANASAGGCSLAVVHVNVIPMDTERVLPNRTITILNGQIVSIAPTNADDRHHCTRTIDGQGLYLSPGLNDMHVHLGTAAFTQAFGMKTAAPVNFPAEMALYMANGVTGIRVMSGAPDILAFRNQERRRLSRYPRLVVATPMLSGQPPVLPEPMTKILLTPEAARDAVRAYKRDGYDFVKVRDNLSTPVFRAVIAEAKRQGLYVDGHISQGQGLSVFDVLRSGQKAIAHLDNLQLLISDKAHDPDKYIQLLRACGCFVETTMQVEANAYAQLTDYDRLAARPELKYVNPVVLNAFWLKPNNPYLKGGADPKFFHQLYVDEKELFKKLYDAGVHFVAGTDSLNPMIVGGASLHDELSSLVEAGLTPYQAIKATTADPAAYVPGFSDTGVLATGRVANAVLTSSNPLKDVNALRSPEAVMINGNWLTKEDLQRSLDNAAVFYAEH
jgi:imidazolonepropionase-like amidohydrolase